MKKNINISRIITVLYCLMLANNVCNAQSFDKNGFNINPNANENLYQKPNLIDNVYQIKNTGNLYWFSDFVNKGGNNAKANAILTDNIVVNTDVLVDGKLNTNSNNFREWIPIGYYENGINYQGTFDGNGHIISGLYFNNKDQSCVGLFGIIGNNATINNVGIVDSYFNGNTEIGGLCGINEGKISNCYSICLVCGDIHIGGLCGYNNEASISNCYNLFGREIGFNEEGFIENVNQLSLEKFKSGAVAYLLSHGKDGDVWGQKIGTDKYPTNSDFKVYSSTCCNVNYEYTNNINSINNYSEHIFDENGICKRCNQGDKPEFDSDNNTYLIKNVGNLYWFMNYVNLGGDNVKANAVLTDNIIVNSDVLLDGKLNTNKTFLNWFPIGYNNINDIEYQGIFEGNGYTISGLYFNNQYQSCVGLFGLINKNATIKNLGIIDSYFNGNNNIGGVCGFNNEGTISNCYSNCVVSGHVEIGGISGYNNEGIIKNCYSCSIISGDDYVNGVCGLNYKGFVSNCYNNSDFYNDNNLTTFDFCNGILFEGFDNKIWNAGSISSVNNNEITFTLPHFINGYKPTVKGIFTLTIKKGAHFQDNKFSVDNINNISITIGNNTYNDKTKLKLIDLDLSDKTIKGTFYEIDFEQKVIFN
ncbi:MAG: hypothetical protein MJ211_11150 [Bacteroidales bacterium]|nr:hypothetical protein [Bacteroidales bacterium]